MKTQLLKKLTIVFVTFIMTNMNAQTTDFTVDESSWDESWGSGSHATVTHDGTEEDGVLKVVRNSDNANFGIKGTTGVVDIDAATKKFIKIRFKNATNGTTLVIGGKQSDNSTAIKKNDGTNNIIFSIDANDTAYKTMYIDMSSYTLWDTDLRNFYFQVKNNQASDTGSDAFYLDEIEFLTSLPITYSAFTPNPSFDDDNEVLLGWTPDTKSFGTVGLSSAESHAGTNSLAYTFTDQQSGWWAVNSVATTYDPGYTAGTEITTSLWVKASVAQEYKYFVAYLLDDVSKGGASKTVASGDATTWQELTWTYTVPGGESFTTAKTRISLPTTGTGFVSGNILYVDDITTTFSSEVILSNETNVLEGVSVYPNPAKDLVRVSAPKGSSVSLSDLTGSVVKQVSATSDLTQISVADLASGIYVVSIVSEGKSFVTKLVVE